MSEQFLDFPGLQRANVSMEGVNVTDIHELNIPKINPDDRKIHATRRKSAIKRENMIPMGEVEFVKFGMFTDQDIIDMAAVKITSDTGHGPGSVRDTKMGPHNEFVPCGTCSKDIGDCPGHHGRIELPTYYMRNYAIPYIILVLSSVCNNCGRLLVTEEQIKKKGINNLHGLRRLQAIRNLIKDSKMPQCPTVSKKKDLSENTIVCGANPKYESAAQNKEEYTLGYKFPGDKTVKNKSATQVKLILDAISDEDAKLLGYDHGTHPSHGVFKQLLVSPYNVRADVYLGDIHVPDHLTLMYYDIIRAVNKINRRDNKTSPDNGIADLYSRISNMIKNDGKYKPVDHRPAYLSYKKRIQGKTAVIRGNIMGKRVNFAARTVADPGSDLRVDEIGVPEEIANKLTVPVIVTEQNKFNLQSRYDNGRIVMIKFSPSNSVRDAGYKIPVNAKFKSNHPNLQLRPGDEVDRYLENGDPVIINRQPTLHKQSIIGLKVKIHKDRVFKTNLSITTPLGLDYDGDEINLHVPQTSEAMAEAMALLSTTELLLSEENNKPSMGIVQDSLSGSYLLTLPEFTYDQIINQLSEMTKNINKLSQSDTKYIELSKTIADKQAQMKKLYDPDAESATKAKIIELSDQITELINTHPDLLKLYNELSSDLTQENKVKLKSVIELIHKHPIKVKINELNTKINILKSEKNNSLILDPFVFNQALNRVSNEPDFDTLKQRCDKQGVKWGSGRCLFSGSLPEDFDYYYKKGDNEVNISNGILKSGLINKDIIGNVDGSIITEMTKQLGGSYTIDFMSNLQFIILEYMQHRGLSVSLSDCIPNDPKFRLEIKEEISKSELNILQYTTPTNDTVVRKQQETKILNILEELKQISEKKVKDYLDPQSGMLIMASSGAKGSEHNILQIAGLLAQQKVNGERIRAQLPGNRTLATFAPGDTNPAAFGMCYNSYSTGLEPSEYFFHSQNSRENLTDMAINTSQTGFLQHQMIKALEDIHTAADGSVRTSDNAIVQFVYGDDGFDPSRLTKVIINDTPVPFFANLTATAKKINRKYSDKK